MRGLIAASALTGACHPSRPPEDPDRRAEGAYQVSDPSVPQPRGGPGIDPVPPPNVLPPVPDIEPGELTVETAWLNGRQLVVHITAGVDIDAPVVDTDGVTATAAMGPVPHLMTAPPKSDEPVGPASDAPPPPAEVVHEPKAPSERERWMLLRNLTPNATVRILVRGPAAPSPAEIVLRLPRVLGGAVYLEAI